MIGRMFLRVVSIWLLTAGLGYAHDLGVAEARLIEESGSRYTLSVLIPLAQAHLVAPPRLPSRCRLDDDPRARQGSEAVRFGFSCGGAPLGGGDTLFLPWQREGVLLTAHWRNGSIAQSFASNSNGVIRADLGPLRTGLAQSAGSAWDFWRLGVEHILTGIDHLMFVLGLILIVEGLPALLKTVTAFTLAHSITLGLAVLGWVRVPGGPVEAAIALSIVLVAAEGLRRDTSGLAKTRPWMAAFAFGLLHGFGFAGALSDVGLPAGNIPMALLWFNFGVEAGQIAFVMAVLIVRQAIRRARLPAWTARVPGYAIGTAAMVWFVARAGAMFQT